MAPSSARLSGYLNKQEAKMNTIFAELLNDLELRKPIVEGEWAFVPLSTRKRSRLEYLTLFEAADAELVTVTEVTAEGTVSAMKVANNAALPLFIPDGITLVGCKQNRVVNVSLLIPARSAWIIPVSCVERRRWSPDSTNATPSELCDPGLRSAVCDQTTSGLLHYGTPSSNQAAIWQHVDDTLGSLGAASATSSYHAAYAAARQSPEIKCPEGANGVAIVRAGNIYSIDLFDQPSTLKKLWPRIVRGTLPMTAGSNASNVRDDDLRGFLVECLARPQGEFSPIGLGTHHRFRSDISVASGLVVDGQLLHLFAFRRDQMPPTERQDNQPRRPWWRLWQ